jgi:hypothetical protein
MRRIAMPHWATRMMNIGSATYKKGKPEHVNKNPAA